MPIKLAQTLNIPGSNETINGVLDPNRFPNLASLVNNALPIVFAIAGIILFLYLIWGGFDYLTSIGDPKKAEAGKNKITTALIGFIIIFLSYWIVQIIDYIFDLKAL